MSLEKTRYGASFFGDTVESGGIQDNYGYKRYNERFQKNRFDEGQENNPYSSFSKEIFDKLTDITWSGASVLDVGGASGGFSEYAKERLGVTKWDVLDLNVDTWAERHKFPTVDNFIAGDALVQLPLMAANQYDVIFSCQFLECISDVERSTIIKSMNKVGKKQAHIITVTIDPLYQDKYKVLDLNSWRQQGLKVGTILMDYGTKSVVVV